MARKVEDIVCRGAFIGSVHRARDGGARHARSGANISDEARRAETSSKQVVDGARVCRREVVLARCMGADTNEVVREAGCNHDDGSSAGAAKGPRVQC
ncbi:MAG: hypothetical protein IPM54_22455 [Polyangiaceae bacterium]|nr:hypothetical protein [Polyangiaceae bacterium]